MYKLSSQEHRKQMEMVEGHDVPVYRPETKHLFGSRYFSSVIQT